MRNRFNSPVIIKPIEVSESFECSCCKASHDKVPIGSIVCERLMWFNCSCGSTMTYRLANFDAKQQKGIVYG